MDCQQEGDEGNLYAAWGRRCRPFMIFVEFCSFCSCDAKDEPDEGVLFQIVAVVKWTYTSSFGILLGVLLSSPFLKIQLHWNIQLTVQVGSGALLFVLYLQNSNVSGPKSQQVQSWLFPVYLCNFLKKKKVMNGLFRDGSSGQNTQTPRDRHKRCYSLKLLTHQAASRSYMWHIMCGDPKNTVVSINSLSTVSDQPAGLLFHPTEMFCLRNSWMFDWKHWAETANRTSCTSEYRTHSSRPAT